MSWYQKILASCSTLISHPIERSVKDQKRVDRLASMVTLYDIPSCTESILTRHHIKELNIPITVKNIKRCYAYEKELLMGIGNIKVPCLRIEDEAGAKWIQNFDEIIDYLDQKFMPKAKLNTIK